MKHPHPGQHRPSGRGGGRGAAPEERIRRVLRRTWHPFFARFGRLTKTQCRAVEPVLSGADVLLSAPTATGKTEAVCAPAIERVLGSDGGAEPPSLMVVAPTRALCNDLARRLHPPVRRSGLEIDIKTGDSPGLSTSSPPHVLVTTPESLDSMLCRRTRFLRSLRTVVFDELHLLHGTPRGDHLQCLSERLLRVAPGLQRCATSATVPRVDEISRQYLGAGASSVTTQHGARGLTVEYARASDSHQVEAQLREIRSRKPGSKTLVFVNRRAQVEWLSGQLRDIGALGHHGSLSREHRLRVEKQFLDAPSGLCIATMTLEVGVDIGDIDRVVLVEPPPDVCSFRQRIGRANRRSGEIHVTLLHATRSQLRRFEHMVECTRDGRLFGEATAFRPSVAAQQAVSLSFQNPQRWVSAPALHARLPKSARAEVDVDACRELLAGLEADGWLHSDSVGRFNPDEHATDAFKHGSMHCNISPDTSVEVVEETTRRMIGKVSRRYLDKPGDEFAIAGRKRSISRIRDARVFVDCLDGGDEVIFDPNGAPRLSFDYCQDLADFLDVPPNSLRYRRLDDGTWQLDHFLGTLWGEVLAGIFALKGYRPSKVGAFSMVLHRSSGGPPHGFNNEEALRRAAKRAIKNRNERLSGILQPGPFDDYVSESLELDWLLRCVDLDSFTAHLLTGRFEQVERLAFDR